MSHVREARQRLHVGIQAPVAVDIEPDPCTPPHTPRLPLQSERLKGRQRNWTSAIGLLLLVVFAALVYGLAIATTPPANADLEKPQTAKAQHRPLPTTRRNTSAMLERSLGRSGRPARNQIQDDAPPHEDKREKKDIHPRVRGAVPKKQAAHQKERSRAAVVPRTEHAFVSVISNEKYVDGAIVLALSLFAKSHLLKQKRCELVLLGPPDLMPESAARLKAAGYSQIKSVSESLAELVPESSWKDTFDKLFLWSFTEYKLMAFFDADMLALQDPDSVFDYRPPNASWIGAHGSRSQKYFQTGMMVIMPDMDVFDSLLQFFKEGVESKKFTGLNARDGQVARAFFGPRYIRIPAGYSMYRNASESIEGVKGYHFRGKFKPWYNMNNPPKFKPSHANGAVEFGSAYRIWWEYYESFHKNYTKSGGEASKGYGGSQAGPGVSPTTHVWMLRYTADEYVQKLWSVALQENNVVYETMTALVGHRGDSCKTVCTKKSLECNAEGHSFTPINSCEFIAHALKKSCTQCVIDASDPLTPSFDPKTGICNINYLHDKLLMPTCEARSSTLKRVCVCVPPGAQPHRVPFQSFDQISLR